MPSINHTYLQKNMAYSVYSGSRNNYDEKNK